MASTIKLKTSTSSGNVPASLSKGEVAINVADGVWYYGGNSAVQQNFTFGRITVTGDTNLDGKLVVTGNTVMNGTLSATTRLQVGNGDGLISGHTTSSINSTVGNVLNITGGDGAITFEGASSIKIPDNTSSALVIEEANNAYLSFFTTNASPVIQVHQPQVNTNTLTVGVDGTGHDVKFFGDTAGQYMLWDESADKLIVTGEIEATKFDGALEGNADTATKIASITNDNIVQLAGAQTLTGTKTLNSFKGTGSVTVTDILDEDAMGSNSATALATQQSIKAYVDSKDHDANTLQEVTTAGATSNVAITLSNDFTVGVDDTGHDVKFFGATSGQYMLWDQSADKLIVTGEIEATKFDGALEGNADTATVAGVATNVTLTDNESTDENNAIIFGPVGNVLSASLQSDGDLTYNPSTGKVTATGFVGDVTGDISGNAATSTKIAAITNTDIVVLAGAQTLTGTKTLNSFKGTGSVTVTDIKDTDNFSDATDTSLATSESIKAYVDSKDHDANTLQEVTTAGATSNVAITLSNDLTVGVDDTGHDVKFFGATSGAYMLWDQSADDLIIAGAGGLSVDGVTNLDNTDIDGTFTMDGTAFDVNGTTTVAIDNTNTTNGVTINTVTSGSKVFIGHTTSETTVNDNLTVTGALTMGTTAAMTSSGLLSVGTQSNITRVGTLSELTVDNVNIDTNTITSTSGGLTVTATEGRVLLLGGAESPINALSDVSLNGNLVVTGNTVMNGSLSATTSCKIGNGDGLISAATIDSITQKVGNGTSFNPRPNLYWFGNCDAATVGPASDGSFPATNTTDVSWGETYNSHATVFSASSDQVQIVRGGLYKVTYNVTLEGGADGSASNRTGGGIALLRKVAGGTYAVVDGTESYVYCRINNIERNTGTVSVVCNVTANDVFKIVFIRTGVQTSSSKLGTVTAGTAWTIEAVS